MKKNLIVLLCLFLIASGCAGNKNSALLHSTSASSQEETQVQNRDFFDDTVETEVSIADPFEPWNRVWFNVNDFLLLQVFKPLHKGYSAITPKEIRSGISNAADNIQAPIRIVNSVLQGEFAQGMVELGRFIVNSTAGFAGVVVIIPEQDALVPINLHTANFDGTLSKWGFGQGFYLVWPIFGPSSARGTFGIVGDTVAHPIFWATEPVGSMSSTTALSISAGLRFNDMGTTIQAYEALTKSALEPYVAVREAYINAKRGQMMKRIPTMWQENPF